MARRLLARIAVLLLAGCTSSTVPVPPDSASPQQVVQAYVAAVDARDCDTAKTLYVKADLWCGHSRLDDLVIDGTTVETKEGSPGTRVEHVGVSCTLHGGDDSMPDGHHDWGYLLERSGPNGAWRNHDEGVA